MHKVPIIYSAPISALKNNQYLSDEYENLSPLKLN
jgi:hypothetical protein